jgi:single-stranded-DNA-specific exonuclease
MRVWEKIPMLRLPAPQWILRPVADEAMRRVEAYGGSVLSPLVARLIAQRGPDCAEAVERYLNPKLRELSDPFLLPNMEAAVARLLQAVERRERVVLYGDYDVDGVCSLTLLRATLLAYGLEARCFLPLRMEEGYGVSREGLERCLAGGGLDLLIAVDCGTSSRIDSEWLLSQGIEMLVLDHHEPDPARLPPCPVVNPKLGGTFHYLCSAGVVFKLGHALGKRRRIEGFDLRDHLDLVALATVADIVPLVGENRVFVRKGLQIMETSCREGLRALIEIAGVKPPIDSMDLGFRLGPRLNAAGRLDTAQTALDLLLCENRFRAMELAQTLDRHNRERQEVEHIMQQEAQSMALRLTADCDPSGLVLASREWHPGVVGIVAARLMRKFHRPVFVIAIDGDGTGKGSGRSVDGVSLVAAIDDCRDLLLAGGGHEAAAGLTIREENLETFRGRFADCIARQLVNGQLEPKLYLDAETRLSELSLDFLDSYERLQPFGQGNPRPLFMVRGVQPVNEPRLLRERHWKFDFYQDGTMKSGVWFNGAHDRLPSSPWDVAFHVDRNIWRGETTVQMLVQDMRTSQ